MEKGTYRPSIYVNENNELVFNDNGLPITKLVGEYVVGQTYKELGGTIFYILQPGDPNYSSIVQKGLVANVSCTTCNIYGDIGTGIWGGYTNIITSPNLGTGLQNTIDIINALGGTTAAKLCYDLVAAVPDPYPLYFSDWYLPSRDELILLANSGFILDSANYWTSTTDGTIGKAYFVDTSTGTFTEYDVSYEANIHAIRSF